MDRAAWWVTVRGVSKSRTRLRDEHFHFTFFHFMLRAAEAGTKQTSLTLKTFFIPQQRHAETGENMLRKMEVFKVYLLCI